MADEMITAESTRFDRWSESMTKPYKLIDLFAGAGGMTLGFQRAGFVPVLAVEKEPDFAATYFYCPV